MILGTAAYMAPEQARGKSVDRRADVWAFGVVLYEMLSGRQAFEGDDISEVLAAVLKSEPVWTALPAGVPASIRRLLRRCLEKDPRKRLSAIGDARLDLDEADGAGEAAAPAVPVIVRRSLWPLVWAALAGGLVAATAAAVIWTSRAQTGLAATRRVSLLAPPGTSLYPDSTGVAISPDGTMIAFVVGDMARSETHLWVRSLDSMTARMLEDTQGATLPFWSPDSRQIGFFSTTKLKAISPAGGRAQVIADIRTPRGGAWSSSNVILFSLDASGPLYRVSATGGTATPATALDASRQQNGHRFPSFLPDGDHFLYAALPGRNGRFDIFAGSLSGGAPTLVGAMETAPVYSDGYLLFARQGTLVAQPFDAGARKLTGDPVILPDEPSSILDPTVSYTAGRPASVGANGTIAYYSAASQNTTAEWYDALGRHTGTLPLPPGHYDFVRISPDGTQAAIGRSLSASESNLWLVDLARGGAIPLSSGPGRNDSPVWSPDGTRVIFSSNRDGNTDFFVKTVGDASPEQPFFRSPVPFKSPVSWSADGKWIIVTELDPGTTQNVWLLPATGGNELKPLVVGPRRDLGGPVSPDGHWLAYLSDETGRYQLYVQPFPAPGRRVQVSTDGAIGASWRRDGRGLFFFGDDGRSLWRVDVSAGATFTAGTPSLVARLTSEVVAMDAAPDQQRFLALVPERSGTGSMTVVFNWRATLDR